MFFSDYNLKMSNILIFFQKFSLHCQTGCHIVYDIMISSGKALGAYLKMSKIDQSVLSYTTTHM